VGGSECHVLVGIPANAEELEECIAQPRGRDLVASQRATAQQYTREIISPLSRLLPAWRELGVHVRLGCTLTDMAAVLRARPRSLVLVSHWQDMPEPRIETFDGMRTVDEVTRVFPQSFDGFIDLSICRSLPLARSIRARCPGATAQWINCNATPAIWFFIYTLVFRLMAERKLAHLDALEAALDHFRRSTT